MKLSLTRRYLLYLLGFMTACLVVNFGADILFEALQGKLNSLDAALHELQELGFYLMVNLVMLPVFVYTGWRLVNRMVTPIRNMVTARYRRELKPNWTTMSSGNWPRRSTGLLIATMVFSRISNGLTATRRISYGPHWRQSRAQAKLR